MAITKLTNTFGAAEQQRLWTYSAWIKRTQTSANVGENQVLLEHQTPGGKHTRILFSSSDQLRIYGSNTATLNPFDYATTRRFRDLGAWYHIYMRFDSQQAVAANRMKIYINGIQESAFDTQTAPTLNDVYCINADGLLHNIGRSTADIDTFTGVMSNVAFVDGFEELVGIFGEIDGDTGEWKPIVSPAVTNWGTNGFHIMATNSELTDSSTNSNTWTLSNGTLTPTKDSPSNNFTTWDANVSAAVAQPAYENGATGTTHTGGVYQTVISTMTMGGSGKYYAEFYRQAESGVVPTTHFGVANTTDINANPSGYTAATLTTSHFYQSSDGDSVTGGGSETAYGDSYGVGNYIGIAIDLDNNKLYFSKDGVWQNSGDPTSGATGTGALSLAANETWYFILAGNAATSLDVKTNFGNGYFGTTAVASAGTASSTPSIWEYDCPTDYQPLSTRGLNA